MDGELLRWLYHRLLHDPKLTRTRDCTYGDGLVLLIYLFACANNRAPRWAHDRRRWPIWCQAVLPAFPSYSQLCRRLNRPAIGELLARLDAELRDRLPRRSGDGDGGNGNGDGGGNEKAVDGRPLTVNGYSHDPDATCGRVPDGWARGYKAHVVVDAASGAIEACAVTPLSAGEATVLRQQLLPRLDLRGCTLRGDANYDSNATYAAVAAAGGRHVAQRRKPGRGLGHHRQHPDRRRAVRELEQTPGGLAAHKRRRNRVEQVLAHLANLPIGLATLPPFLRRLRRVRPWVAAKVMLYHLHLAQVPGAQQAAA